MIKAAASLLVLFAAATAQAGSFGGPPPFTNGSPLPTGDDGVYQASMRGKNLSGIFTFTYSSGAVSSSSSNNYYVFVNGQVYSGSVQASISTSSISGVLDTSSSASGVTGSGYFNGSIDKNSSTAAFDGDGKFTLVDGNDSADSSYSTTTTHTYTSSDGSTVTETSSQSTDSSTGGPTFAGSYNFKFQGVRAYIPATD
ncbi:hypothetical protein DB345_17120 [Spartobacteria bacterium LR76]|nr:hypothetical protein DB345_17120 [Spartobacteria bacterium LR76]